MLAVLILMCKDVLIDWHAVIIAIIAGILTFKIKISPIWIIVIGAILGYVLVFTFPN
jgi:chromate transporter